MNKFYLTMSYSRLTNYQFNIWLGSLSMLKWDKALASHSKFKMISIDPQKKHDFRSIKCLRNSKLITLIREVKPYTVFEPTEVVNSKTKKLRISRTFLSLKLNLHFQRFIPRVIYRSWYRSYINPPIWLGQSRRRSCPSLSSSNERKRLKMPKV